MPRYLYKAKKGPAEIVQGEIDAENEAAALTKLTGWGLVPLKLEPEGTAAAASRGGGGTAGAGAAPEAKNRVRASHQDMNIFTRQFSILSKASVPLLKIFDVLSHQSGNVKFRSALTEIKGSLSQGSSLSEVLAEYPRLFSQVYVSLIHSGEMSGTLDQVLARLAEFADKESEMRNKVRSALIYPLLLLLVGIGTIFVLITFVMPKLMVLFADLGTELPAITRFMMGVSDFFQRWWIVMGGVIAALFFWFRTAGLSASQQRAVDGLMVKLPGLGKVVEKAELARFLRSLELLYDNGIPLYQAVGVASRAVTNSVLREQLEKIPGRLEGGASLAASLEQIPFVSEFIRQMVSVGEESGQLGPALGETARFFEQETDQIVRTATSLIEPLMILGIGIVVGFIVISMLLPIFEISAIAK